MSTLTIHDILQADNLIDHLPEQDVTRIGMRALEEFNYDLDSRRGEDDPQSWEQRYDRYLDIAMQVRKAKTFPWPGAANLKFPLLTTAAIQFQARAYPVIVDGANLVKGRVLGDDPDGAKRKLADLIANHMTWQLLFDMPGWEDDTDRLLLMLPIVGCVFRKTYYDSVRRKNVSKIVTGKDFVINYWATSLDDAPRFTQIMRFYPYEVEERIRSGLWAEVRLPTSTNEKDESDTAPIEFLEQHRREDLDGDGYPEPYVVTLVRETGQVVRIVPCFDEDGVTVNRQPGEEGEDGAAGQDVVTVIRIDPKRYFTKYGFIPAPDGSFYDTGFGALLDDITAATDTIGNQLLDAGSLQNSQGGFVGNGVNMRSGDLRFRLGEWKRVEVTGGTLAQNIVPLNLPGPSPVLLKMFEILIGMGKEITSVQDILTGAGQGLNTPATTVLAQIEQATKVMTAIFKRIHRSFGQELRMLFGLNKDFLPEQANFSPIRQAPAPIDGAAEGNDSEQVASQIGRADYQKPDVDIVPVSDPTQINDALKALRSQALMPFLGDPLVNQKELRRRIMEGAGQPDISALLNVPPPPPDPKLLLDSMDAHNTRDRTLSEIRRNDATAAQALSAAAAALQPLGFTDAVTVLVGASTKMGIDASKTGLADEQPTDGPGEPGGMAPEPDDAGVSAVPGGPPVGPDPSMGVGGAGGDGGAGAGGDAQQADPALVG